MRLGHQPSQSRSENQSTRRPSGDIGSPSMGYADMSMNGNPNAHVPISIMQGHGRSGSQYGAGFAAARSPPKSKSTSHVPCKFFPLGQCQAGSACQFSHDLDPTTQNAPCKYFSRGSCKFGQSCALLHVLPDGRIINRPTRGGTQGYNRRGTNPNNVFAAGPSTPLSINTQEQGGIPADYSAFQGQEGLPAYTHQANSPIFRAEVHPSNTSSPYGSPHGDLLQPKSPPRPGLSARDAQLPSSWDSQGISHAARNGPFAASVPGRFGIESPPSSYPNKAQLGNTALRDRDSAFADTANLDGVLHGLGSSPREIEPFTFAKRPLHSERFARPRPPVSSSLDIRHTYFPNDLNNSEPDSDSDDGAGEDLLPSSLHDLIPIDKLRRPSRSGAAEEDNSYWGTQRRMFSNGTSADMKPGSMSPHSSSPSRYSAMWAARSSVPKSEAETNPISAFGHVGSPLRPSNLRTSSTNTSPPPTNGGSGLSMLTSQLQRARLGEPDIGNSAKSPPSQLTAGDGTLRPINPKTHSADPSVTSSTGNSVGASAAARDKADDETMFSMEDEADGLSASDPDPAAVQVNRAMPAQSNGPAAPRTWAMAAAGAGRGVGVIGGGRGK
ncbi:hypothetical protein K461DRAFT_278899 [Myriangium duriaei CBS 260.36]|uniref:C3H1-type domain-containing protein n=1 Tax=Myriangium duriaei CBS 260.36 TaxID=1168546 RepID=A0A9P4IZC3_9PEZI|nr:hypothetical protein K461DRAFT_278899 [Myriangium duriaei CBS 260.36]